MSRQQFYVPPAVVYTQEDGSQFTFVKNEELGRGSFAVVYKVTDQNSNETYAMKVVSKTLLSGPKGKKITEKLKNEIAIQGMVNHPNIVTSKYIFSDEFNYYFILEYCPGKNIREYLKKSINNVLTEVETRKIIKDVLNGLLYLHNNDITHYDIKIENFLIDANGNVKIADFGLSIFHKDEEGKRFSVSGTPNYLAPEILRHEKRDQSFKVDIWAVGISAYMMLIGKGPFESSNKETTFQNIKKCLFYFPSNIDISKEAKDFIKSILKGEPAERPTAKELLGHPFITTVDKEKVQLYRPNHLPQLIKPVQSIQKAQQIQNDKLPQIFIQSPRQQNKLPQSPKQANYNNLQSPRQTNYNNLQSPRQASNYNRVIQTPRDSRNVNKALQASRRILQSPRQPSNYNRVLQSPRQQRNMLNVQNNRQPNANNNNSPIQSPRQSSVNNNHSPFPSPRQPSINNSKNILIQPPRQSNVNPNHGRVLMQTPMQQNDRNNTPGQTQEKLNKDSNANQTPKQSYNNVNPVQSQNKSNNSDSIAAKAQKQSNNKDNNVSQTQKQSNNNDNNVSQMQKQANKDNNASQMQKQANNDNNASQMQKQANKDNNASQMQKQANKDNNASQPQTSSNYNPVQAPRQSNSKVSSSPRYSSRYNRLNMKTFEIPNCFITRHCFYCDNLGYLLGDGTVGICFKDTTRIVMDPFEHFVQYYKSVNNDTNPQVIQLYQFDKDEDSINKKSDKSDQLSDKIALVRKVAQNFKKIRFSFDYEDRMYDSNVPLPNVNCYVKNDDSILFKFNDKNIQVNFADYQKLIIFWNTKNMCFFRNIKEKCCLLDLKTVASMNSNSDELKKFKKSKEMLSNLALTI